MLMEFVEEHDDGSASYVVELEPKERDALLTYGLMKLFEQAAKDLKDDGK